MKTKLNICGKGQDRIPDKAFKMMAFFFKLRDFFSPFKKKLSSFQIMRETAGGITIVDYGCGIGSYERQLAELAGENGKVYAVDIHHLAIEAVNEKIKKYNLTNVIPIQARGYSCQIPDNTADIIIAIDMFHMVEKPNEFLSELHRIIKSKGSLIIEPGHQSREESKAKLLSSHSWDICEENKIFFRCKPVTINHN
jgi:ubiquinone/menaquinone biosynthesis C-methylase UbiE